MVAVADELERKGFVERRRDAEDRRAHALHTTARGRSVVKEASKAVGRVEAQFLGGISANDRQRLKRVLREVISHDGSGRPP